MKRIEEIVNEIGSSCVELSMAITELGDTINLTEFQQKYSVEKTLQSCLTSVTTSVYTKSEHILPCLKYFSKLFDFAFKAQDQIILECIQRIVSYINVHNILILDEYRILYENILKLTLEGLGKEELLPGCFVKEVIIFSEFTKEQTTDEQRTLVIRRITSHIERIIEKDIRQFSRFEISNLNNICFKLWNFSESQDNAHCQSFIQPWLNIIIKMLDSKIITYKIEAFGIIHTLLAKESKRIKDLIENWTVENKAKFIIESPMLATTDTLTEIFGILTKKGSMTIEDFNTIWAKEEFLHSSELYPFYRVIAGSVKYLDEETLGEFSGLILNERERTPENEQLYNNFLADLCENISECPEHVSTLVFLVTIAWELVWVNPVPKSAISISKAVKKCEDDDLINGYLKRSIDSYETFKKCSLLAINELIELGTPEDIEDLCNLAVDGLFIDAAASKSILDIIEKRFGRKPQLEKINELLSKKPSSLIIKSLLEANAIPEESLLNFFKENEIDKAMVTNFRFLLDKDEEKYEPLAFELIALGKKEINKLIARRFITFEDDMAINFMNHWKSYYVQDNDPEHRKNLILLLSDFKEKLKKYKQQFQRETKKAFITGDLIPFNNSVPICFNEKNAMLVIYSFISKYSGVPINGIKLICNGVETTPKRRIKKYKKSNEYVFSCSLIPESERKEKVPDKIRSDSLLDPAIITGSLDLIKEEAIKGSKEAIDFLFSENFMPAELNNLFGSLRPPFEEIFKDEFYTILLLKIINNTINDHKSQVEAQIALTENGTNKYLINSLYKAHKSGVQIILTLCKTIDKFNKELVQEFTAAAVAYLSLLDINDFKAVASDRRFMLFDFWMPELNQSEINGFIPSINGINEYVKAVSINTRQLEKEILNECSKSTIVMDFNAVISHTTNQKFKRHSFNVDIPKDIIYVQRSFDETYPGLNRSQKCLQALSNYLLNGTHSPVLPSSYIVEIVKWMPKMFGVISTIIDARIKSKVKEELNPEIERIMLEGLETDNKASSILIFYYLSLIDALSEGAGKIAAVKIAKELFSFECKTDKIFIGLNLIPQLIKYAAKEIYEIVEPLFRNHKPALRFSTEQNVRGKKGTVGLVNLGNTCFFNSMLQQFYGIPSVREAVLKYNGSDPLFNSLKSMFASMVNGKAAANPKNVAMNWKTWSGDYLDTKVQQDAAEFVIQFIDHLEKLDGNPAKSFSGFLRNSIDGIETQFHTESRMPFTTIDFELQTAKTIDEAMDRFTEPTFFTGQDMYNAEGIGKINAKQISKIDSAGDHIIVVLKRFEFDMKTYEKLKISSEFEFKENIDFGKIWQEPGSHEYTLGGVIAHSGNINIGHYISYVKNRSTGEWNLFNDDKVSPETIENVTSKLTGGNDNERFCAYILFYDRVGMEFPKDDREETPVNTNAQDYFEEKSIEEASVFADKLFIGTAGEFAKQSDPKMVLWAYKYALEYGFLTDKFFLFNDTKSDDEEKEVLDEVSDEEMNDFFKSLKIPAQEELSCSFGDAFFLLARRGLIRPNKELLQRIEPYTTLMLSFMQSKVRLNLYKDFLKVAEDIDKENAGNVVSEYINNFILTQKFSDSPINSKVSNVYFDILQYIPEKVAEQVMSSSDFLNFVIMNSKDPFSAVKTYRNHLDIFEKVSADAQTPIKTPQLFLAAVWFDMVNPNLPGLRYSLNNVLNASKAILAIQKDPKNKNIEYIQPIIRKILESHEKWFDQAIISSSPSQQVDVAQAFRNLIAIKKCFRNEKINLEFLTLANKILVEVLDAAEAFIDKDQQGNRFEHLINLFCRLGALTQVEGLERFKSFVSKVCEASKPYSANIIKSVEALYEIENKVHFELIKRVPDDDLPISDAIVAPLVEVCDRALKNESIIFTQEEVNEMLAKVVFVANHKLCISVGKDYRRYTLKYIDQNLPLLFRVSQKPLINILNEMNEKRNLYPYVSVIIQSSKFENVVEGKIENFEQIRSIIPMINNPDKVFKDLIESGCPSFIYSTMFEYLETESFNEIFKDSADDENIRNEFIERSSESGKAFAFAVDAISSKCPQYLLVPSMMNSSLLAVKNFSSCRDQMIKFAGLIDPMDPFSSVLSSCIVAQFNMIARCNRSIFTNPMRDTETYKAVVEEFEAAADIVDKLCLKGSMAMEVLDWPVSIGRTCEGGDLEKLWKSLKSIAERDIPATEMEIHPFDFYY